MDCHWASAKLRQRNHRRFPAHTRLSNSKNVESFPVNKKTAKNHNYQRLKVAPRGRTTGKSLCDLMQALLNYPDNYYMVIGTYLINCQINPITTYKYLHYMFISSKPTSVAWVPRVQPINT